MVFGSKGTGVVGGVGSSGKTGGAVDGGVVTGTVGVL
jgi:hypothetical protein